MNEKENVMQVIDTKDTERKRAVRASFQVLRKFFVLTTDVFEALTDDAVIEWALQITTEGHAYKLRNWQYNLLIGVTPYGN